MLFTFLDNWQQDQTVKDGVPLISMKLLTPCMGPKKVFFFFFFELVVSLPKHYKISDMGNHYCTLEMGPTA